MKRSKLASLDRRKRGMKTVTLNDMTKPKFQKNFSDRYGRESTNQNQGYIFMQKRRKTSSLVDNHNLVKFKKKQKNRNFVIERVKKTVKSTANHKKEILDGFLDKHLIPKNRAYRGENGLGRRSNSHAVHKIMLKSHNRVDEIQNRDQKNYRLFGNINKKRLKEKNKQFFSEKQKKFVRSKIKHPTQVTENNTKMSFYTTQVRNGRLLSSRRGTKINDLCEKIKKFSVQKTTVNTKRQFLSSKNVKRVVPKILRKGQNIVVKQNELQFNGFSSSRRSTEENKKIKKKRLRKLRRKFEDIDVSCDDSDREYQPLIPPEYKDRSNRRENDVFEILKKFEKMNLSSSYLYSDAKDNSKCNSQEGIEELDLSLVGEKEKNFVDFKGKIHL